MVQFEFSWKGLVGGLPGIGIQRNNLESKLWRFGVGGAFQPAYPFRSRRSHQRTAAADHFLSVMLREGAKDGAAELAGGLPKTSLSY